MTLHLIIEIDLGKEILEDHTSFLSPFSLRKIQLQMLCQIKCHPIAPPPWDILTNLKRDWKEALR